LIWEISSRLLDSISLLVDLLWVNNFRIFSTIWGRQRKMAGFFYVKIPLDYSSVTRSWHKNFLSIFFFFSFWGFDNIIEKHIKLILEKIRRLSVIRGHNKRAVWPIFFGIYACNLFLVSIPQKKKLGKSFRFRSLTAHKNYKSLWVWTCSSISRTNYKLSVT